MRHFMPLKKAVVKITEEAEPDDLEQNKKAIKSWHNRLSNGSIPRYVVLKLGRQLFLDVDAFEKWATEQNQRHSNTKPGRPRAK